MFVKDRNKSLAVRGVNQMDHFVHDDVLDQVLGFFGELRIQPDGAGFRIAAAPFGFHALEKIAAYRNA